MGQVVEDGAEDRGHGGGLGGHLAQLVVDDGEIVQDLLFVGEDLDVLLALDHFLNIAVDRRGVLLLGPVAAAADFRGGADHDHHNGAQNHHDGEQLHGQNQHHGDGARQRGDGDEHLGDAVLQKLVGGLDVVGVVAHEAAVGVGIKVADRQLLHFGEQLRPQVPHDDRAALQHEPVQEIIGQGAEDIQGGKAQQQRRIFGEGLVGREAAGLQQVHQRLHAVGRADGGGHIDQDGEQSADEDDAAVLEIPEQPSQGSQGRPGLSVAAKLDSRHAVPPPLSSGCHRRRDRSGCGP